MKIWFDVDNGPHVLVMRPLARELVSGGHDVVFTARDRANCLELLERYGFEFHAIGTESGPTTFRKVTGTFSRALSLARFMRGRRADVSFGHGSRSLPIASRLLRIPTVTMYDYEWVDARIFNRLCSTIIVPQVVSDARCVEAGIDVRRVAHFNGLKEQLYVSESGGSDGIAQALGLRPDSIRVLIRPPARNAHYHNPQADVLLDRVLEALARTSNAQVVFLPRSDDQVETARRAGVGDLIIPDRVFDGPGLVSTMDLVISGGGTMIREAAAMGVPAVSFFRGRTGMVDEDLERSGRLVLLEDPNEVESQLIVRKRPTSTAMEASDGLVSGVCDLILAAAR